MSCDNLSVNEGTTTAMGKYTINDTPAGLKTLVFMDAGRIVKLHSAYDPARESERIVASFKTGRSSIIIVAGLALGYHVNYLKKKYPSHKIMVIERDSEVEDIVHKIYPENLKDVLIIKSPDDIPAVFEGIDISISRGVSAYIHRPSYMLDTAFYDSIISDIKEYISSRVSDLLTRFEFEEDWIENIFQNIHHLFLSNPVCGLFGKFKNIPGMIVSAGPSLKKNVSLLNEMRDRALIVCVDTAFKVLQKHHVKPHIVMTLDSQKHSFKHFNGLTVYNGSNPVLLADIVSSPRILDFYKGSKLISTTTKYSSDNKGNLKRETTPVWDWIEEFTGSIGDIQSGGSVATSVFDLLINLGCSHIILVGQDLAYTGREIHCTGTHHNDGWLPQISRFLNLETINQNVIRKRKIKYVEAFGGKGKVISDFIFDIYKKWFEDSAKKISIPVINATEGGARIQNTAEKALGILARELDAQLVSPEKIIEDSLKDAADKTKKSEPLLNAFNTAVRDLEYLEKKCVNFSEWEEILDMINKSSISRLITPFLRKTFIYISRHPDIPKNKALELLTARVSAASKNLLHMLKHSKINLEKIR